MNQSIRERSSFVLSFCFTAIFVAFLGVRSPVAYAAYIVNTGPSDVMYTGGLELSRRCNFIAACSGGWQAGEFTIESDVVIHSLEGWIGVTRIGQNGVRPGPKLTVQQLCFIAAQRSARRGKPGRFFAVAQFREQGIDLFPLRVSQSSD